eukprot:4376130-Prorocentrum_lima.AAC.1
MWVNCIGIVSNTDQLICDAPVDGAEASSALVVASSSVCNDCVDCGNCCCALCCCCAVADDGAPC